ncbi:uncharacterized protein [Diabrotica undecimpunctata]|uniref:uncharacterized protein isoform X2 n=1 Tax=Diabrotica undecimpunctata TaxID=50387 RepID=UPI003B63DACB
MYYFLALVTLWIVSCKGTPYPQFKTPDSDCIKNETKYYPDPYNCTQYYVCDVQNQKVLKKCTQGKWWNDLIQACDVIQDGVCSSASSAPTTAASERTSSYETTAAYSTSSYETTSSAVFSTTLSSTIDPSSDVTCDTELEYFPDPDDCRKFYQCYGGIRRHMECSFPLLWNVEEEGCKEDSDCSQIVRTSVHYITNKATVKY